MLLGHTHARLGRISEACQELAKLKEMSEQKYVPATYMAFVCAGLEDRDQAFAGCEKAYEERSNYLIYFNAEPSVDRLRSDPRFRDLLGRIGLL